MKVWRCDLTPQADAYLPRLLKATEEVLRSGRYVLGEKLKKFEAMFAEYQRVKHCIGVANGTDALILGLRALGIEGEGVSEQEVITTPFTAVPTVSAIVAAGARPVFVDINPDTFLMEEAAVISAISSNTKAIVPVHLFAQMVDVELIRKRLPRPIPILEDAAQAHGCRLRGKLAGSLGELAAFSFYPTKNLGGYGDGGCLVTDDDRLAEQLFLARNYGKRTYDEVVRDGVNSRLDELQAAYLAIK